MFRCTSSDAFVIMQYLKSDKKNQFRRITDITADDLEACRQSAVRVIDETLTNLTANNIDE